MQTIPFAADAGVWDASGLSAELISVSGCSRMRRHGRSRETGGCFANTPPEHPITLTVRGRRFPEGDPLQVVLEEHRVLPVSPNTEEGNGSKIVIHCDSVRRSDLFPKQLLSCTIPHPAVGLRDKPAWLKRLTLQEVWMDLKLVQVVSHPGSKNNQRVLLGVLPRAVQFDLTTHGNDDDGEAGDENFDALFRGIHNATVQNEDLLFLGIGGLHEQLKEIFRRVFLTRFHSLRALVGSIHLPAVRGVLLHGPPGTGKTLIARTIARLAGGKTRVTIVNAADILSKYVGDSEKNLQSLFREEDDDNDNDNDNDRDDDDGGGDDSDSDYNDGDTEGDFLFRRPRSSANKALHIVIIDELEALFRRRDGPRDESSAKALYDGLTNQLLNIMDGMDREQNILIIALTNQLHLIDRALLRPGRFEVVIRIPLPDAGGRREMFFIHTHELRKVEALAPDVDIDALAAQTGGFSGADIAGTVRAAVSHAMMRHHETYRTDVFVNVDQEGVRVVPPPERFKVTRDDFARALRELRESKGQTSRGWDAEGAGEGGVSLVNFDGSIARSEEAVARLMNSVRRSHVTHAAVVLLYGPSGTGKTVLAQHLVSSIPFDATKFLAGTEFNKGTGDNWLDEVTDSLRYAMDFGGDYAVVIDNMERYLDRAGSGEISTLKSLIAEFRTLTRPSPASTGDSQSLQPHPKRLLIITTSEREVLHDLSNSIEYDLQLTLQSLRRQDVLKLLQHYGIVSPSVTDANTLLQAYPLTVSYRQFLRITDLALWRAHETLVRSSSGRAHKDEGTAGKHTKGSELSFYAALNARFRQGVVGRAVESDPLQIVDAHRQKELAAAVQEVVAGMGLSNVFVDGAAENDRAESEETYL
ncbi:putative vesicular-fusion protein SEC18 [Trypanosoma vivax]|nr:putative vesicular-fusion protein SEC18 [Trypanosoma vivax]